MKKTFILGMVAVAMFSGSAAFAQKGRSLVEKTNERLAEHKSGIAFKGMEGITGTAVASTQAKILSGKNTKIQTDLERAIRSGAIKESILETVMAKTEVLERVTRSEMSKDDLLKLEVLEAEGGMLTISEALSNLPKADNSPSGKLAVKQVELIEQMLTDPKYTAADLKAHLNVLAVMNAQMTKPANNRELGLAFDAAMLQVYKTEAEVTARKKKLEDCV